MIEIGQAQAIVDAAKDLLKATKERHKKGETFRAMGFDTHTIIRRAAASDRLTDACFSLDKSCDQLHKVLVDANFTKPKERESYGTRTLTHSAGFGHSISFKYMPPLPKCYQ
jgi:hypothetical protein